MKVQNWSPSIVIKSKERGRPLLHGGLDKIIQTFLRSRAHGGVVNTAVVISVKDALVKRYLNKSLAMCIFELVLGLEFCSIIWDL